MAIFEAPVKPTFSDLWYRVGPTRPRLSPHAQYTRQRFGPQVVAVVEDQASGQYWRLSEAASFFVGLLDGARTVDDAWQACCAQMGDDAPTQRECIEVLGKLQRGGLILGEQPISADMLRERQMETRTRLRKQRTGNGLFFTLPILNPEPLLERFAPIIRAAFSPVGAVAYCVIITAGLWSLAANWSSFTGQFNAVTAPDNVLWIGISFLLLRAWHELGHASAVKAFGGRCTEIGLMLMTYVLPFPYCDASSAWRFPEVWKRVVVSAGGMLFETAVAGVFAVVWAWSEPGTLRSVSYTIVIVSGFTTILFNANPLLRYDGYYILSDVLGSPNLWQRSRDLWKYLLERVAFGVRGTEPPAMRDLGEAWALGVFWVASTVYRWFVLALIVMLLSERYMTLGLVLATVGISAWLVWPALKAVTYLFTETRLAGRRARALAVSGVALAAVTAVLAVAPMPSGAYATATLEPWERAPVRAEEQGMIRRIAVKPGSIVERGQVLMELENPEIATDLVKSRAGVSKAEADLSSALVQGPGPTQKAQAQLDRALVALERAESRAEGLTLRAATRGRFVPAKGTAADLENLEGRFVDRGTLLALVADTDRVVARANVSDREQAHIFRPGVTAEHVAVEVRVKGRAGVVMPASIVRVEQVGGRELRKESLAAAAGGDIVVDPTDPKQRTALTPQFVVDVLPRTEAALPAGLRARVRFELPDEPLASQWWRRLRQYIAQRTTA